MTIEEVRQLSFLDFGKPLESHLFTSRTEWFALLVVKFYIKELPELMRADAPDLQNKELQFGIEVTEICDERSSQISGIYSSYQLCKLRIDDPSPIISKYGGSLDDYIISYPTITCEDEINTICNIYTKKLDKIKSYYKNGFVNIELVMIMYEPPVVHLVFNELLERLKNISINKAYKYNRIYIVLNNIICVINESFELEKTIKIEEYDLIKKCSRLLAEERIRIEEVEI